MKPRVLISTVGTSLLTNETCPELRNILIQTANWRESEYDADRKQRVDRRIEEVKARLQNASHSDIRKLSAELNGILGLNAIGPQCSHFLLATDTFQGEATAEMIAEWLRNQGCQHATPVKLEKLNTGNEEDFRRGIDDLLKWCDEQLQPLRAGDRIIFNLVGGFKSLQAYAHTLGMIYADEIVYLFEGAGSPLLRIPRLPIHFDEAPLKKNAPMFARMDKPKDSVPAEEVKGLPEAYFEISGDDAALSLWGELAWSQVKREILTGALLCHSRLVYESSFQHNYESINNNDLRIAIQEALAKAAVLWARNGLQSLRADGGLQYEDYSGKNKGIGHFRVNDGPRISCKPDGSNLRLRHCGAHDVVNNNP